jgi:hypothetical protein
MLGLFFDTEVGGDVFVRYVPAFSELHRVIAQKIELFEMLLIVI